MLNIVDEAKVTHSYASGILEKRDVPDNITITPGNCNAY